MRMIMTIAAAAATIAVAGIAAPTSAEARFDAGLAANVAGSPVTEVQYYYGYRKPYYAPRYYAPPPVYYAPPRYYKPRYRYY